MKTSNGRQDSYDVNLLDRVGNVLFYPVMETSLELLTNSTAFKEGHFSAKDALVILEDVGMGLHVLHDECNVLHLDIKPSNIMISEVEEEIRGFIIDFGCATPFDRPTVGSTRPVDQGITATLLDVFGTELFLPRTVVQQLKQFRKDGLPMKVPLHADVHAYAHTCAQVLFGRTGNCGPQQAMKHLHIIDSSVARSCTGSFTAFAKMVKGGVFTVASIIEALDVIKKALHV
jgi:serine/threonine protein kinase